MSSPGVPKTTGLSLLMRTEKVVSRAIKSAISAQKMAEKQQFLL
jgi:hypothetical protein